MVDAAFAIENGEPSGLVEAANVASGAIEAVEASVQPIWRTREEYVQSLRAPGHTTEAERLARLRASDWRPNIGVWEDPTIGEPA